MFLSINTWSPPGYSKNKTPNKKKPNITRKEKPKLSAKENRLLLKYGKKILINLKKSGSSPKKFYHANALVKLSLAKIKTNRYRDAIYLLMRAYEDFPSPVIRFWQAKTYFLSQHYFLSLNYFNKFLREIITWKVTPISNSLKRESLSSIKTIKTKKLLKLNLKLNIKGATVHMGEDLLGISPLKQVFIKKQCTLLIRKNGYVDISIKISSPTKSELLKTIEMITPTEKIKRNKIFLLEQKRKQKLASQLKRERVETEIKTTKRNRIFRKVGWIAVATGGTALLGAAILGTINLINKNSIENANEGESWSDYEKDYAFFGKSTTLATSLTIGGGIIAIGGSVLLYIGYRSANTKQELSKEILTKKGGRLSLLPLFSKNFTGISINYRY
jgi:hypothetical protein